MALNGWQYQDDQSRWITAYVFSIPLNNLTETFRKISEDLSRFCACKNQDFGRDDEDLLEPALDFSVVPPRLCYNVHYYLRVSCRQDSNRKYPIPLFLVDTGKCEGYSLLSLF